MKYVATVLILVTSLLQAAGAWMMSGRTHPELNWHTIETDHFDVHYHEGIRDIAVQGASIAEQVRPILMEQMGLDWALQTTLKRKLFSKQEHFVIISWLLPIATKKRSEIRMVMV